jgi:hypothetical protein
MRFVRHAPRWLDRQPLPLVVAVGIVLGLGIGLPGFLYPRSPAWVVLWGVLLAALWRLSHDAEPVFEEANPIAARPQRVRDGPLVMMELPGGSFWMGSPDTDDMARENEKPQHQVTVSSFRIAVTPVTIGVYHEVMQREALAESAVRLPAIDVKWDDAIAFCNKLSDREGYQPCYRRRFRRWVCDWRADGYRLPTEAEWEYSYRAGTTTRYSFGRILPGSIRMHGCRQRVVGSRQKDRSWGLYECTATSGNSVGTGQALSLKQVRSWELRNLSPISGGARRVVRLRRMSLRSRAPVRQPPEYGFRFSGSVCARPAQRLESVGLILVHKSAKTTVRVRLQGRFH